jgi:hypothetical protein
MAVDTSNATASAGVDSSRLQLANSIKQAASSTGVSFEYLLTTAKMESNFNPQAGASTSSAHGLYQFIDQTWLGTVKEAGNQLGYGQYSSAITKNSDGSYSVSDPTARNAIMKLRDDASASTTMAAALTQSNSFKLTGALGRRPTDAELYMAHFMGVGGASKLISSAEDTPSANAAAMFPKAAAANHSIFYDKSGSARSTSQVYSTLTSRYSEAANSKDTRTAIAAAGGDTPNPYAVAGATPMPALTIDTASYLSTFPNAGAATAVGATSQTTASAQQVPAFRSLYQSGDRAQPISPAVQELWGSTSASSSDSTADATSSTRSSGRLDLFSDPSGAYSSG